MKIPPSTLGLLDDAALLAVRGMKPPPPPKNNQQPDWKLAGRTAANGLRPMPAKPEAEEQPDGFDRFADSITSASHAVDHFNHATMLPVIGIQVAPMAIKGLGSMTGIKPLEKFGEATGKVAHATWSQAGKVTGLSGIASGLSNMVTTALSPITSLGQAIGLNGWAARGWEKKLGKHMGKASEALEVINKANISHPELAEPMKAFREFAAKGPAHWEEKAFEQFSSLSTALSKHGHEDAAKAVGKFMGAAGEANLAHTMHGGWKDLPQHMKNGAATKYMGSSSIFHAALSSTFVFTAAAGAVGTAEELHKEMKTLVQLAADATGKKKEDISIMGIAAGSYGKTAQGEFWGAAKKYGVPMISDILNTIVNARMMLNGKLFSMFGGMALMMGIPMAGALWKGYMGSETLPVYGILKKAQAHGEVLPPDAYAKLVGCLAYAQNGKESSHFAQALGHVYAAKHATVEQVLRDHESGHMQDIVKNLKADYAAKKAQAEEVKTETVSHEPPKKQEKKDLGKWTLEEIKREAQTPDKIAMRKG